MQGICTDSTLVYLIKVMLYPIPNVVGFGFAILSIYTECILKLGFGQRESRGIGAVENPNFEKLSV